MKAEVLIVALCVCVTISAVSHNEEILGLGDMVLKMKEFYDYLQTEEFENKLNCISIRINEAPSKAVECFIASAEGNENEINATADKIRKVFKDAFNEDKYNGNDNGFQTLNRIVQGILKVTRDKEVQQKVKTIAEDYGDAANDAIGCFKTELLEVKTEAEKFIEEIKSRFF